MNDTAVVHGSAISDLCVKRAGMLNLRIYDTARDSVDADLHPHMDVNDGSWALIWEENDDDGYRCAFYQPVGSPGQDPSTLCPPVLVFRGSDSEPEDFAELAFGYDLTIGVDVEKPLWYEDTSDSFTFASSHGLKEDYNGKTLAQMRMLGLIEEKLFEGVSGTHAITIDAPLWFEATVTLTYRISASLFYGTSGDWAVNFAQGLGKAIPEQYIKAMNDGRRAGAEAARDWGGRIIVTGHSLGGGLASAAAIAMRTQDPDLVVRCDTFNAAGLHEMTLREQGLSLSTAGDVPVRARHVKDEILNSMQARSRLVPILADLLAWGGKSMPPAVANPSPSPGISPGAMSISGQTYAPKYSRLPVLYTVNNQTLAPRMTELDDVLAIANGARTVNDFVTRLIDHLVGRFSQGTLLTKAETEELQAAFGSMTVPTDFAAQIQAAIMLGGAVPTLTLTGSTYITGRIAPLINALIADLVTLARVVIASGEYHTFPPCAFTFLDPRSTP